MLGHIFNCVYLQLWPQLAAQLVDSLVVDPFKGKKFVDQAFSTLVLEFFCPSKFSWKKIENPKIDSP
jgi:hypothetical protein